LRQIHNAPERQYFQAIAQTMKSIFSGNCSHNEEQLQGAVSPSPVCWDGNAYIWKVRWKGL